MNWPREQFLFLFSLIAVGLCISIDDERLDATLSENDISWLDVYEDEKSTVQKFSYVVSTKMNKPCILANMGISIVVPTGKEKETQPIDVPSVTNTTGTCSSVISTMELSWPAKEKSDEVNRVSFTFINDHTNFSIFSIQVDIYYQLATGSKTYAGEGKRFTGSSDIDLGLFAASATNGMHTCSRATKRPIGNAEIIMKDVSLIAFNTTDDISSRIEKKCADEDGKSTLKAFPLVLRNNITSVCSLAKMSISLEVPYKTKKSGDKLAVIKVPRNVGISGHCDDATSRMNLNWTESSEVATFAPSGKENIIKLALRKNGAQSFLSMMEINIFLDEKNFPDAELAGETLTFNTGMDDSWFHAAAENGLYSCPNTTTLKLKNANVHVTDVLLVAFDVQKDFSSKKVTECRRPLPEDSFNYVVKNDEKSVPCILTNMSIIVTVPYKEGDTVKNTILDVSKKEVKVNGTCYEKHSIMNLMWSDSPQKEVNTLKFHIGLNKSDFFVHGIEANIFHVPEEKFLYGSTDFDMKLFFAPANNGLYNCTNRVEEIQADKIHLNISNVVLVAFDTVEDLSTKKVRTCPDGSNTPTSTTVVTSSTTASTSSTSSTIESTSPTSTTIQPTVEPDPSTKKYNYVVTNPETQVSCIVANMSIFIKIPYQAKDSKTKEVVLQVPKTAKASGKCEDASSSMDLIWLEENSSEENAVTLSFKAAGSKYTLRSMKLNISLDEKHFPNAVARKYEAITGESDIFSAPLKSFYKCQPETAVKAKDAGIILSKIDLIAFNKEKTVAPKSVENCLSEASTSNVGAIVGGIIGGIILISAIVFLYMMYKKKRRFW